VQRPNNHTLKSFPLSLSFLIPFHSALTFTSMPHMVGWWAWPQKKAIAVHARVRNRIKINVIYNNEH